MRPAFSKKSALQKPAETARAAHAAERRHFFFIDFVRLLVAVQNRRHDEIFEHPEKDYTRELLDAIPGGKLSLGVDL